MEPSADSGADEEEEQQMPHIYILRKHPRRATRSQGEGSMADALIKQVVH